MTIQSEETTNRRPLALRLAPWVGCVAIIALLILATTQWRDWTSSRTIQTTQNAFVKSDFAVLSTKVSGYIKALPADDYQTVRAGQLIAQIDDSDYVLKVASALAQLSKAQANLDNLDREISQQRARIKGEQANASAAQVRVRQYRSNPERQEKLVRQGALSRQLFESAQADLDHAVSQHEAAIAQVDLARQSLAVLEGQRGLRAADVNAAAAELEGARRDLDYTRIIAPFDGVLNKRHVQLGSLVSTGTQIVSIVPSDQSYVIANYKETQLAHVQPGQPVVVSVDGLPGRQFRGRVREIAPMSGAESALLPADNASGNFTKVVQRIPVRIDLAPGQRELNRLHPGMSVEASVNTKGEHIPPYTKQAQHVAYKTQAESG